MRSFGIKVILCRLEHRKYTHGKIKSFLQKNVSCLSQKRWRVSDREEYPSELQ